MNSAHANTAHTATLLRTVALVGQDGQGARGAGAVGKGHGVGALPRLACGGGDEGTTTAQRGLATCNKYS